MLLSEEPLLSEVISSDQVNVLVDDIPSPDILIIYRKTATI